MKSCFMHGAEEEQMEVALQKVKENLKSTEAKLENKTGKKPTFNKTNLFRSKT